MSERSRKAWAKIISEQGRSGQSLESRSSESLAVNHFRRIIPPNLDTALHHNHDSSIRRYIVTIRVLETTDCHQIVTKDGAKQAKTNKLQKTQIQAKLRLAKGFS
jgi:hypothetical protein